MRCLFARKGPGGPGYRSGYAPRKVCGSRVNADRIPAIPVVDPYSCGRKNSRCHSGSNAAYGVLRGDPRRLGHPSRRRSRINLRRCPSSARRRPNRDCSRPAGRYAVVGIPFHTLLAPLHHANEKANMSRRSVVPVRPVAGWLGRRHWVLVRDHTYFCFGLGWECLHYKAIWSRVCENESAPDCAPGHGQAPAELVRADRGGQAQRHALVRRHADAVSAQHDLHGVEAQRQLSDLVIAPTTPRFFALHSLPSLTVHRSRKGRVTLLRSVASCLTIFFDCVAPVRRMLWSERNYAGPLPLASPVLNSHEDRECLVDQLALMT